MHEDLEILCLDCVVSQKIYLSLASHENLRTPPSCLMQGFSAFPLWTFLAGWFFVEGRGVLCTVGCLAVSLASTPLDAKNTLSRCDNKNVPRLCQMPLLRRLQVATLTEAIGLQAGWQCREQPRETPGRPDHVSPLPLSSSQQLINIIDERPIWLPTLAPLPACFTSSPVH